MDPLLVTPKEAEQIRAVVRAVINARGSGGIDVSMRDGGLSVILRTIAEAEGAVKLKMMKVATLHNDYLTCNSWDGTTQGTADILVAKPRLLRHGTTIHSEYSSWTTVDTNTATVILSGVTFTAKTTKPYAAGSVIHAIGTTTDSDDAGQWLDLNVDARFWGRY